MLDDDGQEIANFEAWANNIEVAGLSDLYLDRGETFVTGTLHLLADVTVTGAVRDLWGDSVVYQHEEVEGAAVEILVSFELDVDGNGEMTVDRGRGNASTPIESFHLDPPAALVRVLRLLEQLPLVSGVPSGGWPDGVQAVNIEVLGRSVVLKLNGATDSAWVLEALVDDAVVGKVRTETPAPVAAGGTAQPASTTSGGRALPATGGTPGALVALALLVAGLTGAALSRAEPR